MKHAWTIIAALVVLALPAGSDARKLRRLAAGAVSKPGGFTIRHPFPCGVPIHVNCAYGPACSPAHKRTHAAYSTNDRYAVDFVRVAPNNGYDKSIVAVAPGVVLYAGWAKRGWAPYGKLVYVQHRFKDQAGHRYQTLYAHLNRVKVRPGQKVRAGTVIGTLGGSSRHRLGRFGPHLHFAMYRDAKRTLGGGRAVLPEPMGAFNELRSGMDMIACGRPEPVRVAAQGSQQQSRPRAVGGLLDD